MNSAKKWLAPGSPEIGNISTSAEMSPLVLSSLAYGFIAPLLYAAQKEELEEAASRASHPGVVHGKEAHCDAGLARARETDPRKWPKEGLVEERETNFFGWCWAL